MAKREPGRHAARDERGRPRLFRRTDGGRNGGVRRRARHAAPSPQPHRCRTARSPIARTRRSTCPTSRQSPLSIATPVLFRARTPLELRGIQSAPQPPPFAGRQFERTDRIIVRFDVFGASAADATVTVTLLSRQGAKLATMPLKKTDGGRVRDRSADRLGRPRRIRLRDRRVTRRRPGEGAAVVQRELTERLIAATATISSQKSTKIRTCVLCIARVPVAGFVGVLAVDVRVALLRREIDRHRHDDGLRRAVHERRHESPLSDGVERGLIEQRDRAEDARLRDVAFGVDQRLR